MTHTHAVRVLRVDLHHTPIFLALAACLLAASSRAYAAPQATTVLASSATGGAIGNKQSSTGRISADGRWVTFSSESTNLVPTDTNVVGDVFVKDLVTGATTRVSVSSAGVQANGVSGTSSISDDGRYVAFTSSATNIATDTNTVPDIFVHDRQTATTTLVSLSTGGAQPNQFTGSCVISGDGTKVIFESSANNLVANDTNNVKDVFLRDLSNNTLQRVNVDSNGAQANAETNMGWLSKDGRYVTFFGTATNLVAGDLNGKQDVFMRDVVAGTTIRVNLGPGGVEANDHSGGSSISADGRFVGIESGATNLVANDLNGQFDAFVRDLQTGTTILVSKSSAGVQGNFFSGLPKLSPDGKWVAFDSIASTLVSGDTNNDFDAFVHELATGITTRVSVTTSGVQGNFGCFSGTLSSDGRLTAFEGAATNLITGDTNQSNDVFVRDRGAPAPSLYCSAKLNSQNCTPTLSFSGLPSVSATAPFTIAAQLVLNQRNGVLFYGSAQAASPFHGGMLCVGGALRHLPVQGTGGNPAPDDCSGTLSVQFNAWIQGATDPALVAGAQVFAQYWYRDGASLDGYGLTQGVQFTIGP